MKILLTGGAGFIASHIADACIAEGHEVVIIDNLSTGFRANLPPKARFYEMDICDPAVRNILAKERPDILNHHAAQINVRRSTDDPLFDIEINVKGFVNLLEGCRKASVKKVILASSGGAIYGQTAPVPSSETDLAEPISPYGINKHVCEQYLHYYRVAYGMDYVALRYANVYGPRQNALGEAGVISIFITRMLADQTPVIYGDGLQTRDYVCVTDVVRANLLALDPALTGIFNIGTGVETDVVTLCDKVEKSVGFSRKPIHEPPKLGEQRRSALLSEKIQKATGWAPRVSLDSGLALTREWFAAHPG